MIRKLDEKDRTKLIKYLSKDPEINLFLIGDIENYGFNSDVQEIWGDLNEHNNLDAVLLRYRGNFLTYSAEVKEYDFRGIADVIISHLEQDRVRELSGKKTIIDKIYPLVAGQMGVSSIKEEYFCKCEKINQSFNISELDKVKFVRTKAEIMEIVDLINNKIKGFGQPKNVNTTLSDVEKGYQKITYIRDEISGKIVSTATSTAESKYSAMIIAVASDPAHRTKGYASACVLMLTKMLIERGKTACLFYDNPQAGSIYKKLGFIYLDKWNVIEKV